MDLDLAALEAEALEAEAKAAANKLSPEQERAAALVARRQQAADAAAAAWKTKRTLDATARLRRARAGGPKYLVEAIDLVDLWPAGVALIPEQLPGGGVLIVRSPEPAAADAMAVEIEHKKRKISEILADVLIASVLDPDPNDPKEGALLRAFCDAYPGAATNAGDEVVKLGGLKAKADKRGRG